MKVMPISFVLPLKIFFNIIEFFKKKKQIALLSPCLLPSLLSVCFLLLFHPTAPVVSIFLYSLFKVFTQIPPKILSVDSDSHLLSALALISYELCISRMVPTSTAMSPTAALGTTV